MTENILLALIGIASSVLMFFLGRLAKKKDAKEAEKNEISALKGKIENQEKNISIIPLLTEAVIVFLEDRLRYIGKCYINKGEINAEDFETWMRMHNAYKAIGGNGYVDKIEADLEKLPRKYR